MGSTTRNRAAASRLAVWISGVGVVRRGGEGRGRAASCLSLRLSVGLGSVLVLCCRSSPVGDVWRGLMDAWQRLQQAVSARCPCL